MKRILKLLASFILLMVLIVMAIPQFFKHQVENFFIEKVNSYIATELLFQDEINLSLIENFPYTSVTFNTVSLRESIKRSNRNVLEAEQISFTFGFWDLFTESYTINSIVVKNGTLYIRNLHDGVVNYDVLLSHTSPAANAPTNSLDDENFRLKLEAVSFKNINIVYFNEPQNQEAKLLLHQGIFSGNIGNERYDLNFEADLTGQELFIDNSNYLSNKKIQLDLVCSIDSKAGTYKFNNSLLSIEDNSFLVDGLINEQKKAYDFKLNINGKNLNIATLLGLLPQQYTTSLKDIKSKGKLGFNASIEGLYSHNSRPAINADFSIKNGEIKHKKLSTPIRDIQLDATLSTNRSNDYLLDINQYAMSIAGEEFSLDGSIKSAKQTDIAVNFDGTIPLWTFSDMVEDYGVKRLSGNLQFNDFTFDGSLAAFKNTFSTAANYPLCKGVLQASDVSFKYNNKWVEEINAAFTLNRSTLQIEQLNTKADRSKFSVAGSIAHFTPMLLQLLTQDSLSLTQPMQMDLMFDAEKLEVTDLMEYMQISTELEESDTLNQTNNTASITRSEQQYAIGSIDVAIDLVQNKKLYIKNIVGKLSFDNRNFIIQQLLMELAGGTVDLRGDFTITKERHLDIATFINCKQLDIHRFLKETNSFGQTTFTHKNIKGTFSTQMYVDAHFNEFLELNEPSFKMIANLLVEDGEILQYKPMLALSKFAKLSELERIRFARIENQIEIKNRKIRVPAMYINSNVLKMTVSGIHTFDNNTNFYIKLNLLDLLVGKFKRKNKSINPEKGKRGINVFFTVKGPADDVSIEFMKRREVKKRLKNDKNYQATDLETILNTEFDPKRGTLTSFGIPALVDSLAMDIFQWSDTSAIK